MSISLTKGQRISLTKEFAGLTNLQVGLGWDPVKQGMFRRTPDIDLDASVFQLDADGKMQDCIYFGNLQSATGAILHTGDNLTGEGEGDDETIYVSLSEIPENTARLVFTVNIYAARNRGQHFGMIRNAYIRLMDRSSGRELCRYNLTDDYKDMTSLIVAEVYRHDGEWKFSAVGRGTTDGSLGELSARYK